MAGGGPEVVELRARMSVVALAEVHLRLAAAAAESRDVVCVVRDADLGVLDVLARLELLRRRSGLRWRVTPSSASLSRQLAGLLDLTGLTQVLAPGRGEDAPHVQPAAPADRRRGRDHTGHRSAPAPAAPGW